jgi:hypothetical protein
VRTVAACAGVAAIPAIYFSLQDASGRVAREADSQLAILCERRSPLGGGIEPFTPEQRQQALRSWTAYFRTADGAERLARAFKELSGSVLRVEPDRTSAPMIDHAAHVILDGDVPWPRAAAASQVLQGSLAERRGKPVGPSNGADREAREGVRAGRGRAAPAPGRKWYAEPARAVVLLPAPAPRWLDRRRRAAGPDAKAPAETLNQARRGRPLLCWRARRS